MSTLLDRPRIAAAIAELPNRHGFARGRDGVPIFWRVFDPGDYGARYHYLPQRHENGLPLDTGLSRRYRGRSARRHRAVPWCCCTAG